MNLTPPNLKFKMSPISVQQFNKILIRQLKVFGIAYGHNYCCMVHSGMNEPVITLSWVWGLDLKWVEQERECISSASTVTSSEIQTSEFLLTGESDWIALAICESFTIGSFSFQSCQKLLPHFELVITFNKLHCVNKKLQFYRPNSGLGDTVYKSYLSNFTIF